MDRREFLLYGANGYTGRLIARYAAQYGLLPVLAGRNEAAIKELAGSLNLPCRVIDLAKPGELSSALKGQKLIINAAGPFTETAKPVIEACLQTGTHYLDINGDIQVFEWIKTMDGAAKEKNIMLLPGAGFDVVPTDCLALHLKNRMPDAVQLKLAFATLGGAISHGTAMTMVNKLGVGGAERQGGKIARVPLGKHGMTVDFGSKKIFVMSIPWGDVSTAHFTTGIPAIIAYAGIKKSVYRLLKFQFLFNWLLRTNFVRNIIRRKIKSRPAGPDDAMRSNARSLVWGQVTNAAGQKLDARFSCADGYTLTAHSCLIIARKVLEGNFKAGYQTPASCYGEDLAKEIPGTEF